MQGRERQEKMCVVNGGRWRRGRGNSQITPHPRHRAMVPAPWALAPVPHLDGCLCGHHQDPSLSPLLLTWVSPMGRARYEPARPDFSRLPRLSVSEARPRLYPVGIRQSPQCLSKRQKEAVRNPLHFPLFLTLLCHLIAEIAFV